jgi:hypothetical protein
VTPVLDFLRSGSFLTKERMKLWPAALLAGFAVAILFLFVTAHGNTDYKGRPLGSDFASFYTAGTFVRDGHPAAPFEARLQYAREKEIFGKEVPFFGWLNPPFLLLLVAPLGALPYIPALVVWQALTLALYLGGIALLLRNQSGVFREPGLWLLIALAFPAVFVNFIHGQNGLLTAALFAGALAFLDERPMLAGVLFALLVYKPQFGIMIPLALVATGRWRTLGAAAVTVIMLAAIVTTLFGWSVWNSFLASMQFAREFILEQGGTGYYKMQSVFAGARMLHAPVALSYVLQAATGAAAAILLVRIWRSKASLADKGAALCFSALVVTPYSYDYDFAALAPAIALLGAQGMTRGFRPYEKSILVLLWAVPILARGFAETTLIPLGVITILAASGFLVRDIFQKAGQQAGVSSFG